METSQCLVVITHQDHFRIVCQVQTAKQGFISLQSVALHFRQAICAIHQLFCRRNRNIQKAVRVIQPKFGMILPECTFVQGDPGLKSQSHIPENTCLACSRFHVLYGKIQIGHNRIYNQSSGVLWLIQFLGIGSLQIGAIPRHVRV